MALHVNGRYGKEFCVRATRHLKIHLLPVCPVAIYTQNCGCCESFSDKAAVGRSSLYAWPSSFLRNVTVESWWDASALRDTAQQPFILAVVYSRTVLGMDQIGSHSRTELGTGQIHLPFPHRAWCGPDWVPIPLPDLARARLIFHSCTVLDTVQTDIPFPYCAWYGANSFPIPAPCASRVRLIFNLQYPI